MAALPPNIMDIVREEMDSSLASSFLEAMTGLWREVQETGQAGPSVDLSRIRRGSPSTNLGLILADAAQRVRPPQGELTTGGSGGDYSYLFDKERIGRYNPSNVTWDQMILMEDHYLIRLCLDVRALPLVLVFRNDPGSGWDIIVQDGNETVQAFCRAAVQRIILRLATEIQSARFYGFFAGEKVWTTAMGRQLGLEGENASKVFWVLDKIKGNHPRTVELKRNASGRFDGYTQRASGYAPVEVPAEKAFVYPYRSRFDDLYGHGLCDTLYAPWWWLEFTWAALMRYLERRGTPVAVCYAPSDERISEDGSTSEQKDALAKALEIAIDIARSNAAAIPSDLYESGAPKWRLEYLQDSSVASQFESVIDRLEASLIKAAGIPENVLGQQKAGSGAYAAWRVPADIFAQTLELDLIEFCRYFNDYILTDLCRYNFSAEYAEKGVVTLTTQGMDSTEIDRIMQLIPTFSSHEDAAYVDYLAMMRKVGIPVYDDQKIEQMKAEKAARREQMREQIERGIAAKEEQARQEQPEEEGEEQRPAEGQSQGLMIPYRPAFRHRPDGQVGIPAHLNFRDALLTPAIRMLGAQGHVTLRGVSPQDLSARAMVLLEAGLPPETPLELVLVDSNGTEIMRSAKFEDIEAAWKGGTEEAEAEA